MDSYALEPEADELRATALIMCVIDTFIFLSFGAAVIFSHVKRNIDLRAKFIVYLYLFGFLMSSANWSLYSVMPPSSANAYSYFGWT